jgi:hypothetical protein
VLPVHLVLGGGTASAFRCALFVCCACQAVFELAAEAALGAGRARVRVGRVVAVGVLGGDVRGAGAAGRARVGGADLVALVGREGVEVGVIVIGVMPNGTWWRGHSVDEELMLGFGVELAHPTVRKGAELIFHAAAGGEGNAVACFLGKRFWAAVDGLLV